MLMQQAKRAAVDSKKIDFLNTIETPLKIKLANKTGRKACRQFN